MENSNLKLEPLIDANMIGGWQVDFTKTIKKLKEREKYNRIWELIKEKNNW